MSEKRRKLPPFIYLVLILAGASGLPALGNSPPGPKPNFVFILIDDLGYKDLGCFGSTFYETRHIDSLAQSGMKFTDGYAACPVCSPTRSSILTGKYPARLRQTDWIPGRSDRPDQKLLQVADLNYLPSEEITMAEVLRKAGYVTGYIGKWHLGGSGHLPEDQGFELNIAGNQHGSPPSYFYPYKRGDYQLSGLASTGQPGEYLTDRLGEEAAKFIKKNKDRPFFLYFADYAVHTPLQSKRLLTEKYELKKASLPLLDSWTFGAEGETPMRLVQNHPVYAGMVQSMDESVGQILRALRENGVEDNTVVFFFSDNGGLSTAEGWPTSNLPLRTGKGWNYEGGIRVPMIVRWPGITTPGSICPEPVISIDFFPTILEIAGLSPPEEVIVDGESLVPLLKQTGKPSREAIYWHYPHYSNQGGGQAGSVRQGDYKLILFYEDDRVELYNLRKDIGERQDLSGIQPDKASELLARLKSWLTEVQAVMPEPNPDYVPPRGFQR